MKLFFLLAHSLFFFGLYCQHSLAIPQQNYSINLNHDANDPFLARYKEEEEEPEFFCGGTKKEVVCCALGCTGLGLGFLGFIPYIAGFTIISSDVTLYGVSLVSGFGLIGGASSCGAACGSCKERYKKRDRNIVRRRKRKKYLCDVNASYCQGYTSGLEAGGTQSAYTGGVSYQN